MPTKKTQEPPSSPITGLLVLVVLGLGVLILYQYRDSIHLPTLSFPKTMKLGPNPTPTPTKLIQGKETYFISQASDIKGPKITQADIDPLDPKVGQTQTISVKTADSTPVRSVTITFKTDNKVRDFTLTRVSGTELDGIWQTQWQVDDTLLYRYIIVITSKSDRGESATGVAPRS